ncbi:MAG: DNA topoisomerase [Lachnospiraceae bacterium]|nr:DNA topoisomerase [Lachnospiraceae bacterium]
MAKSLFIAEKPSVAQQFADAIAHNSKQSFKKSDGYIESSDCVVTWCVGHLVTMSYPEVYDPSLKKWSLDTIPFLPQQFKYEVIPDVKKQFNIVKGLLNRDDVEKIYVCTDSGREGEYIYRLVDQMANVPSTKDKRRVWIDSQTEEEVMRGIREAKPLADYNSLSDAAYLRAKEDYLMGINFSRVLTLKYGYNVRNFLGDEKGAISVGRVMTCVLGMVVRREREIRAFVKTPFYRVLAGCKVESEGRSIDLHCEFRAVEGSKYFNTPFMYKENGFKELDTAKQMISEVTCRPEDDIIYDTLYGKGAAAVRVKNSDTAEIARLTAENQPVSGYMTDCEPGLEAKVLSVEKKKESKNPPMLFNLAELQSECSKLFKISPDETLAVTQELYEKKLVTYPRTDARVLSTAVAKEIDKNIGGLRNFAKLKPFAEEVLASGSYKGIDKTKYVNDKQITDHYAIIPTGQGFSALNSLKPLSAKVYELICRRFLSIFYPAAVYRRISLIVEMGNEKFFANFKALESEGWMKVANVKGAKAETGEKNASDSDSKEDSEKSENEAEEEQFGTDALDIISNLKKNSLLPVENFGIKMGETSAPKRYTSGSMILAMENAGQLIEDEELRAQIKGSGIGTSATRAEILNKLVRISYLALNKKTQVITPMLRGEVVYEVVNATIKGLLNPELTASWEKGLTGVAEGRIGETEYMNKLSAYISKWTNGVKGLNINAALNNNFNVVKQFYKK